MKARYSVHIRSISDALYIIRWLSLAMILRCTIAGIHFQHSYKNPASEPLPPSYSLIEGKPLAKFAEGALARAKGLNVYLHRGMPLCYIFALLKSNPLATRCSQGSQAPSLPGSRCH